MNMIGFLVVLVWLVPVLGHAAWRIRRVLKLNYPISITVYARVGPTKLFYHSDGMFEVGWCGPYLFGKCRVWARHWLPEPIERVCSVYSVPTTYDYLRLQE